MKLENAIIIIIYRFIISFLIYTDVAPREPKITKLRKEEDDFMFYR